MTPRERILAILVGGLVVLGLGQWGFSKYKTAIETRRNRYQSLQDQLVQFNEQRNQGALADRQMGEYLVRSVSSDPERARSDYQSWLFDVVKQNQIENAKLTASDRTSNVGDLYKQLSFTVTGQAGMPEIIGLIHQIQAKDYLHRIRGLDIKPARENDSFNVNLSIDVASLNNAPVDATPPESDSWRVNPNRVAYTEPILNRNLFEPPNQPPTYAGERTLEAARGRSEAFPLAFKDADEHGLSFDLVDPPQSVSIDPRSGTLRVQSEELTEFDVTVRVTDDGYPRRSVEETLLVKVVDPPPEEPKVMELAYDDAKQTYLTGLVQGANDWTAWMNVRTRGKTLKLRVGDEFEIGSVRGVVESIDADHVQLKVADKLVTLSSGSALKAAVDQTAVDQTAVDQTAVDAAE